MTIYGRWKEMLQNICRERGWEDGKNCSIAYSANASIPKDKVVYTATIIPFNSIETLTIDIEVEWYGKIN